MLRRFGASVVGALVIVCALLIGAIFILGSVAEDNTVSAIDRQARSHVLLSAGALGDAVNRKFQNIEDGVVLAQANLVFQFMSVEDDFTLMPIGGDIEASNSKSLGCCSFKCVHLTVLLCSCGGSVPAENVQSLPPRWSRLIAWRACLRCWSAVSTTCRRARRTAWTRRQR